MNKQEFKALNIKNGELFSMVFKRVAPKCLKCNKANKAWSGLTHCPVCGSELSFERSTLAQIGVKNPAHTTKPGEGLYEGESAQTALENGRLKFYDMNAVNIDGTKGNYRQCALNNIVKIVSKGKTITLDK